VAGEEDKSVLDRTGQVTGEHRRLAPAGVHGGGEPQTRAAGTQCLAHVVGVAPGHRDDGQTRHSAEVLRRRTAPYRRDDHFVHVRIAVEEDETDGPGRLPGLDQGWACEPIEHRDPAGGAGAKVARSRTVHRGPFQSASGGGPSKRVSHAPECAAASAARRLHHQGRRSRQADVCVVQQQLRTASRRAQLALRVLERLQFLRRPGQTHPSGQGLDVSHQPLSADLLVRRFRGCRASHCSPP